jgi:hypothetical protein
VVDCRCPLWVPAKPGGLKRVLYLIKSALGIDLIDGFSFGV